MKSRNALARQPLVLAFAISLSFHAIVLFFRIFTSEHLSPAAENFAGSPRSRLEVAITRPTSSPIVPPASGPVEAPVRTPESKRKQSRQPERSASRRSKEIVTDVWTNKSWTNAERADMDNFLNELAEQARPPSGRELSQKALRAAREMARQQAEIGEDGTPAQQVLKGQKIEPFSLSMYFDAFVRKLNRSAAFVKTEPRGKGVGKALVEISLNPDGSLKSFRVLRADDQQAEIAYIKSVIDRASPFSAFPPDIRNAADSLSILMCILPAHAGGSGFSRSLSGQDC